jgi:hypothetical protein
MSKQTHNALSLMSFGFSMALFMVSMTNCFESIGWAVAMIGSMVYCMFWLLVNSGGAE